ncbi:MAG: DNA polymerase [Lachnospiraceae bacterium]
MRTLHIDLETFSSVSIKSGLYRYVQSPDFEILLFAYSYDYEPVRIVDIACGERIPESVIDDLNNPSVKKTAHNAAFEIYCLSQFYATQIYQWHCTMVHSLYCGFPASLDAVGKAMGFTEDKRKMGIGKSLIRYFCMPCAPSRTNGGRTRNLPAHDPEKWNLFKEYCCRDVETEMEIDKRLASHPFPESEHRNWVLDQLINQTGVALDTDIINGALTIMDRVNDELTEKAKEITGLDNPNSVSQLKEWVQRNSDIEIESLNKATVSEILAEKDGKELVKEALRIRRELGKTSVKKYETMRGCLCADGRIRGLLQFYGANRTGRFAGRLVQVQNLPRNYIENLDTARDLVKRTQTEAIRCVYGSVSDTLSQLIRTAFIPGPGNRFIVADFSAIEARVLAWLAGEQWRLDIFRTTGKIYEASASTMFGVPVERIAKGNPEYALRSKGKVAELALGYQGSAGALINMGALGMGLTEEELPDIVNRWRKSSPRIVDFWRQAEQYALAAVKLGVSNTMPCGVTFHRDEDYLLIRLPSGRDLFYYRPEIRVNDLGREAIHFFGTDQKTGKWRLISTYGGKLTENIVQAVARDLLCNAMMNLFYAGYRINFHVHDEVILEVPEESGKNLEEAIRLMCTLPAWAEGLPLNAAGFESHYYMKD